MLTLAQATAEERGFIIFRVFLVVLVAAGALFVMYAFLYVALSPLLVGTGARRAHRVMTGYVIVMPMVLSNLVAIFGLFAIQLVAIHWLYGGVAGPQRILERAFVAAGGAAPEGVQAEIVSRLRACTGMRSGYGGVMEVLTGAVLFCTWAANWVILLALLVSMLRDLGVTSWSFLAAPVQREIHGRPWSELIRTALARFLHLLFYTLFAGVLFVLGAAAVAVVGWLTMRMMASLLVSYLDAIRGWSGGFLPFILLGSFYVCLLEVLILFIVVTSLLAFIVSRSISLQIEQSLAGLLKLPAGGPAVAPPRLLPAAKAAGLLLGQIFVAIVPVWLVMIVIARFLPLWIVAPVGAVLHVVSFNVVLGLFRSWRHLKPLAEEAWAGRPWAIADGGARSTDHGARQKA